MVAFLSTLLGLGSCASSGNIKSVNVDEFETAIRGANVQLVDVRTAGEYGQGHIGHAINIDVQSSDFQKEATALLSKEKPTYVYCRSGHRSMMAAEQLEKAGFKVVNLSGGIMGWEDAGKPVGR